MKKWISLMLAAVLLVSLAGCASGSTGSQTSSAANVKAGTPSYADDRQIELAAYCGPAREGYRFYNGAYGKDPSDPDGGWNSFITQQNFQDYKDCGFTYLMSEGDAYYDYNYGKNKSVSSFKDSDLYAYMELAEKMGIPVMVASNGLISMTSSSDYRLTDDQKSFLQQMVGDLSNYSVFKGFTFRDEPGTDCAKTFQTVQKFLLGMKSNLYFFTSMLPIYGNDLTKYTTSGTTNKVDAYKDYIKAFSSATGTFAYDYYPLWADPVQNTTYVDTAWYQNLELVAKSARDDHFDTGITVQSCSFGAKGAEQTSQHKRTITSKADISFQVYTALAYGMKYINYFTYWQHYSNSDTESFYSAMVNYPAKNGGQPVKTDAYYAVQATNQEIKKFDNVFLNYDWKGTVAVAKKGSSKSALLAQVGNYTSPRIRSVSATNEAIIGCMKDSKGYDGFMIVNSTDPGQKLDSAVTVTFNNATTAIAYVHGTPQTVTLNNGSYTFKLGSGEGVFVIPIV